VTIPPVYRVPPTPYFNKNGNVVVADSVSLNPTSAITIEAWVYPEEYPQVENRIVFKSTQYNLDLHNAHGRLEVYVDGAYRSAYNPSTVTAKAWHQLVGTYDSNTREIKFYVDAVLKKTTVLSGLATYDIGTSANGLVIGHSTWSIKGYLGRVLIYKDKALDISDIQWNWLNPYQPKKEDLVLWYESRSFAQSLWTDLSGNENHGTPNNVILRHVPKYPATFVTP